MTIDFAWARIPKRTLVSFRWKGPWSDRRIRREFERIERWARSERVPTGVWIFFEPAERTWEVALEVRGSARPPAPLRRTTIPAATVGHVVFDPEVVSPRVVYHGLSDWLRERRKDGTIRSVVSTREVYAGNPWTRRAAWSRTDVQFVVRK
jgi:hypothetical protein